MTRRLLLAFSGYTLLAVLITWPVTATLANAVGGFAGRDSFQHVWLFWWFWEALLNQGQLPSTVTTIYFPQGAAHAVLWIHALVPLVGLPLTGLVGPTVTYNLLLLLSLSLTGLTGYLLCLELVRQPLAAFIGGLIFTFAPIRLGHTAAGHQLLVFSFALPLYTLALWLWLQRPTRRRAALNAVALFLVLISHPNFIGYFLLPITLVLLLAHWRRQGWFSGPQWRQLLLSWLAAGLLFLPFAAPLAADLIDQNLGFLTPDDPGEHSADLLSLALPSPFHPLWQGQPPALITRVLDGERALEEGFNYLGIVTLILIGLALWRRWSQVCLWLGLGLLTMVLSLGPTLRLAGQDTGLPLPYALLTDWPFFSWSRTPDRLNMTTMLAVSIIAAAGAAWLNEQVRTPGRQWAVTLGLTALICLDYLPLWPFPIDAPPVSAYYHQLAHSQLDGGLLELPVTGSRRASNYAMFYQTTHHQPLAGGYIERDPPGTVEMKEFLNQLVSPIPVQTVLALPDNAQRRAILADMRIEQAIAYPALMTDRAARDQLAYLPDLLGQAALTDESLQLYRVSDPTAALSGQLLLLPDQENWEVVHEGAAFRLKHSGFLFLYAPEAGCAAVDFQIAPPGDATTLTWQFNDSSGTNKLIDAVPLTIDPLSLSKGLNTIRLATHPEWDLDFLKIEAHLSGSDAACAGAND